MLSKFLSACFLMLMLTACSDETPLITPVALPDAPKSEAITPPVPHQIALLLPLQGDLAAAGQAIKAGFDDAYQALPSKSEVKIYDTAQAESITALYDQAVHEGANYVVGPLEKNKVALLEHHPISVITIALNNPDTPYYKANLYEFALSPTAEAQQIADKAAKDGYSKALMITPAGSWGQNIAHALQKRWEDNNGVMLNSIAVSSTQSDLNTQIQTLMHASDADVIFLIVEPGLARQIRPLLKYYDTHQTPVYSTSLIYGGHMNAAKDQDLNSTQFCDMPLLIAPQGQWAEVRQKMLLNQPAAIQQYIRLYGLGFDAALLTQHFSELHSGIAGATGLLTLDEHHDILRQLNFAVFENGIPQPLA